MDRTRSSKKDKALKPMLVFVRKRPGYLNVADNVAIRIVGDDSIIILERGYHEKLRHKCHQVFDQTIDNYTLYKQTIGPFILRKEKNEELIFVCFGQTGSGKTFTLFGSEKERGLVHFSFGDMMDNYDVVNCNVYEIFDNVLYDLLNLKKPLTALEDANGSIRILNITTGVIDSVKKLQMLLDEGLKYRTTNKSSKNNQSSRSHVIIQMRGIDKNTNATHGLTFIDLAGSERGIDRLNVPIGHDDSATPAINSSLLALKECIRKLDNGSSHIPYRQSKVSMVLRDALCGNVSSIFMINVVDGQSCVDYTENCLKYCDSLMRIAARRSITFKGKCILPRKPVAFFYDLKSGDTIRRKTKSSTSSVSQFNDKNVLTFKKKSMKYTSRAVRTNTRSSEKCCNDCSVLNQNYGSSDSSEYESVLQAIAGINLIVSKKKKGTPKAHGSIKSTSTDEIEIECQRGRKRRNRTSTKKMFPLI